MSAEDKYDELCADFSEVNKQILNVKQRIQTLTEETASQANLAEKSKGQKSRSELLTPANEKLAELRSELTKLDMEKKQIADKMEQIH